MLGGDRALHRGGDVVDDARRRLAQGRVGGVVAALGDQHVEMDVAVADVAEGVDAVAGESRCIGAAGRLDEGGDPGDRTATSQLTAPRASGRRDWCSRMAQLAAACSPV